MTKLDLRLNGTLEAEFVVSYRTREHGPRRFSLSLGPDSPNLPLVRYLIDQIDPSAVDAAGLDDPLVERLLHWGILTRPGQARDVPEVTLNATRNMAAAAALSEYGDPPSSELPVELRVNQTARPLTAESPYYGVRDSLGMGERTFLIDAPGSGVEIPVDLGPDGGSWGCYEALRRQELSVDQLTADEKRLLWSAGLLQRAEVETWTQTEEAVLSLRASKHAVLRNLFTPSFSATLRAYGRMLLEDGHLTPEDDKGVKRRFQHNNRVMQAVHRAIAPLVSRVTAAEHEPCKPSYSYFSVYERGAELPRHTDRQQCRWNVSLVLDVEPYVARPAQWPIFLEIAGRPTEIRLGVGDGVLYSGSDVPHWREPLGQADIFGACFFHFVDMPFDGPLD